MCNRFTAMKRLIGPLAGLAFVAGLSNAQQETPEPTEQTAPATHEFSPPAEEQPFWDNAQAFVDAYAARDAAAIGELFTEDAEFLDEFGERTTGREAIVELFQEVFESSPETAIEAIDLQRVRYITPDVALEEGVTKSRSAADAVLQPSNYVALHVQGEDGVWRVNTLKNFGQQTGERTEQLNQLAWLVGDWVNEGPDGVVQTSCQWSDDGNFLLRTFDVSHEGETLMHGTQRIGWDPQSKQLRSWTFDSQGGFFEGRWARADDHWLVSVNGVNADGESASGTAVYTLVDAEMITWHHRDLIIGGTIAEAMEPVTMVRRPPSPTTAAATE